MHFELLPHPPYSPDSAPRDYLLLADHKGMLLRKRLGSNEEVVSETELYFEIKNKSFYKKCIELLVKGWNQCFGMCKVFCRLMKEEPSIANVI